MHVHLIGVCGTGMGALAGLLRAQGHRVTGSDTAFHPPVAPALARWGVETMPGWDPANLAPRPELVVVGNVCRPDNPEARAAIDAGVPYTSLPGALESQVLGERRVFVLAGTHGKTTTTALSAFLLREAGVHAGFLVGGIPGDFDVSARVGDLAAPFVIEGDEYDSAFFEKQPKFWRYRPHAALLTSVEHDHVDIYPDEDAYLSAFEGLIARIPSDGLLVAYAGDERVRALARAARCDVRFYALEGDACGDVTPIWSAALSPPQGGATPMDVYGGGTLLRRVHSPLVGRHNARNALGAIALCTEAGGADTATVMNALPRFGGVRRRQELLGIAAGVFVYEDFAHHPSAVAETLAGIAARHPKGRVLAAFEPRSATASRRLHQARYIESFDAAALAVLAPVGRPEIDAAERLDTDALAEALRAKGRAALAARSVDEVKAALVAEAREGDAIVLMSNGTFGGIYDEVLAALTLRG